jgi:sugar/nucleoside kinase (ribokinase family)
MIPNDGKPRRLFFDFADFRKRDKASLQASLTILRDINGRVPVTLSVNEHEAADLFALNGEALDCGPETPAKTERVRRALGIGELVIHTPQIAAAACEGEEAALIAQVYVDKPVRSAGAGDTFNGCYTASRLAGLSISERLFTANAAVRHFLRTGCFPGLDDVINEAGRMTIR